MTAYLLVKTGYKPKTHDLEVIYRKIKEENTLFDTLFDLSNEKENYHFELLRKAYIEARYSKTYKITQEESKFLEDKILLMIALVEKLCLEELK
jgi:HEPN domain-containing protein